MSGVHWPGLLSWSTKYHDGTKPSEFQEMSQENKDFLTKALEEAFSNVEDPNEVFREAIDHVRAEGATDEAVLTALEVADRCCDDPDVARNVEKLDGIQTLLDAASSRGQAVRVRSMELLALLFSNNPSIQEVGFKRGGIELFLRVFRDSAVGSDLRSKTFRTLVALVRGVEAFEVALVAEGGASITVECLSLAEDARLREKAANFARGLSAEGRLSADDHACVAAALAPLFVDAGAGGLQLQYRETVAQCASQLLRAAPSRCPPELVAGVRMRLAHVVQSKDPDEETECSLLQECVLTAEQAV